MDNKTHNHPDEAFLDAAVAEALGCHSPDESDAFVRNLPQADEQSKRIARELKETVTQLAAASPYMEPPAALRGQILAATAPQSFKMEEYRRKHDTSPRMLRWGLAAAILFLVASAWYNGQVKTQLENSNQQLAAISKTAQQQQEAIKRLIDPDVRQVSLMDQQSKQGLGKLLVDSRTNEFMLVMPDKILPPNVAAKVAFEQNGQRHEVTVASDAIVAGLPGSKSAVIGNFGSPLDESKPINVDINNLKTAGMMGR